MELVDKQNIRQEYKEFILDKNHPCIMANAVFMQDNYQLRVFDKMDNDDNIDPILEIIENYLEHYDFESNDFESLIVCFKNSHFESEKAFEDSLWNFLQTLHDEDDVSWDDAVSDDPDSPNFSFSIKGKAFYIIGMHPKSSRLARQTPYPTVVFNLHWQFERLREMGTYQAVKKRIRRRDKKLQGHINPVLKDFGSDSETKQYSGRNVEKEWKCPFHAKTESI